MTDDHRGRMHEVPSRQDTEPPRGFAASILDGLDMADVGEIDIPSERPIREPRPATFN